MGDWDVTAQEPMSDEWSVVSQSPQFKGRPGVRAALLDLMKQKALMARHATSKGRHDQRDANAQGSRWLNNITIGAMGQAEAGMNALGALGGKPYTMRDMYDATRLLNNAEQQRFSARHPGVALATDVVGSLQMPGASTVGKFVVGKTAPALVAAGSKVPLGSRAMQGLRGATVAGGLSGTQGALQARPGEEVAEGTRAGVTGAVMAPVVGLGAMGVSKAAPVVGRTVQRVAGMGPGVEITSVEKLQKALRQAGVTPDAIEAASARWAETGGVDPTLIDLVKEAGGSAEVLKLLGRSQVEAPARRLVAENVKATKAASEADIPEGLQEAHDNYKALFKEFDDADPASVTVKPVRVDVDEAGNKVEVDQAGEIYNKLVDSIKNRSPVAAKETRNYLKEIWPRDGVLSLATLRHMQEDLGNMAARRDGQTNVDIPLKMKSVVDEEIDRIVDTDQFEGDAGLVDKLKEAKDAFAKYKTDLEAHNQTLAEQAANAKQLAAAAGDVPSQTIDSPMESMNPGDAVYPRRAAADVGLNFFRKMGRLSAKESEAALRALTSKDPEAKDRLLKGLLLKYPEARKAVTPFLTRPVVGTGDEQAVETLEEDYGVAP